MDVARDDVALELHNTTDAQVWARQFIAIISDEKYPGADPYDEGFMIGWFANAITAGEIHANRT